MALSNLSTCAQGSPAVSGSACGASDNPSACGASDKPSACGASDKPSACGA